MSNPSASNPPTLSQWRCASLSMWPAYGPVDSLQLQPLLCRVSSSLCSLWPYVCRSGSLQPQTLSSIKGSKEGGIIITPPPPPQYRNASLSSLPCMCRLGTLQPQSPTPQTTPPPPRSCFCPVSWLQAVVMFPLTSLLLAGTYPPPRPLIWSSYDILHS